MQLGTDTIANVDAGRRTEPAWLELQSEIWEPAGQALLQHIGPGTGLTTLDIGCGGLGWLRILSQWVGETGRVIGTDVGEDLLETARSIASAHGLSNVSVVRDDMFDSQLPRRGFDLVHTRFAVNPLDRAAEQMAAYVRLIRPGGWIVLEDNDLSSWHFNPPAPAAERLIHLIASSFLAAGETLNAGRRQPEQLRQAGLQPNIRAEVRALAPGDPYLRLPIHFTFTLEPRLLRLGSPDELASLRAQAEEELSDPHRWGTTFTLIQSWARVLCHEE